ncbi:MATE family efflux transporter [Bacillus spongiae]|uniref:Probable multidrug resistance protein NorM n=1 Tax=Bacillus spongiae TaxID=2683610 RepID=A0ABU8HDU2_9BACI
MKQTFSTKEKIIQLFIILVPILITQLGMFSMSFFDTMMSGQYSHIDLAGVAIGSSIWIPVFTGLSGILLSITPIVSQNIGANNKEDVSFSVVQGLYASLALSVVVIISGFIVLEPLLNNLAISEETRRVAKEYLIALSFGIIPLFISNVLRSFIDALGYTRVSMIITLTSLPLNFMFNYMFIFGKFGLPELGGVGAGIASSITYWILLFLSLYIIQTKRPFQTYQIFSTFFPISLKKWKEIFLIGLPIGLSIFFETSIFSAVTLFMDEYGAVVIAAHQSAINFASFLYMIPLSISLALTIVVGFEVGAKRYREAKQYAIMGILTAVLFSIICGVFLYFQREAVASIYSDSPEVVKLTAQFLLFALFFQLSDAIQAPVQGALRGYKDVNVTFMMTLLSYWIIGLPLGYTLANYTDAGPFGYWIGLIAGLTAGAITLSGRLYLVQKKNIRLEKG